MLFSTIIPTHNRAHLLAASLDSALAQEFGDHEVIVVDAESTDETPEVLAGYAGRITVLRGANGGPGTVRNLGLARASGEYITFLDSDDLWFPWTLATFCRAIEEHRRPGFLAGTHVDFREASDVLPATPASYRAERHRDYFAAAAARDLWIGTCAVAIRAEALRAVGGFAHGHLNAEDSDLWLRLGAVPDFVRIESPPVFAYRRHGSSAVAALDRTFRGISRLVEEERRGAYPGGAARAAERRRILTRHSRPASVACARAGMRMEALEIYRRTFAWNLRQGRARYLTALPILALRGARA